jgi:small conductance mechanosensitive channel
LTELLARLKDVDPSIVTALRIALIMLAAWVVTGALGRLVRLFRERIAPRMSDLEAVKRADTLSRVFRYLVTVVISLITGLLVLAELGISVAPILGAAGVVGIAVGFGAQSLVKDYFTGFFILLENQIRQGDAIEVAGKAGIVEEITLRFVRLRDYEGNVHYVPNGLITTVTNKSREYAQAVVDIGVSYTADIDKAMALMRRTGQELRGDAQFGPAILDEIEIAGVERWVDSTLSLRCRMKVAPSEQAAVRREYLRRLQGAFASAGIEMPQPSIALRPGNVELAPGTGTEQERKA